MSQTGMIARHYMKNTVIRSIGAAAVMCMVLGTVQANDFLIPGGTAHQAGLKVEWNSQLSVGGPTKMVDWFLQINENQSTTYFTMESGPLREAVSNRELNNKGEKYGIEGAKREIDVRAEILSARYKKRNITDFEIKRSSYTLPKSVLYTLTSNGVVSAIDADSGTHYWDRAVDSNSRAVGLGASDDKVAVVLGSRVYCINAEDGRVLWSRETDYSPGGSPAVSDSHIFVPLANGRLQTYSIEENGLGAISYFSNGYALARPLVTPSGVAWATESGHLSFANPKTSTAVNFRLLASKAIISSPTGKGNMIFVASLDGYVYGVDRVDGTLAWEVTTGAAISNSPIPIGDALFVVSDSQQLFKLDAITGNFAPGWEDPIDGVDKFLGANSEEIFGLDAFNSLVVIDQKSGQKTKSIPVGDIDRVLTNYESDRIYMASAQGLVQCVRGVANPRPTFHSSQFDALEASDGKKEKKRESDEGNPFDDVSDPFATAGQDDSSGGDDKGNPFGDDDAGNPFGDDAGNPFGDGADEANSDSDSGNPFGSDSDSDAEDDDDNPFN